MKTTEKWSKMLLAGMAALVLAFGLIVVGCGSSGGSNSGGSGSGGGGSDLAGTWHVGQYNFVFTASGTFTTGGATRSTGGTYGGGTIIFERPNESSNTTGSYSLSGDKLTLSKLTGALSEWNGTWSRVN